MVSYRDIFFFYNQTVTLYMWHVIQMYDVDHKGDKTMWQAQCKTHTDSWKTYSTYSSYTVGIFASCWKDKQILQAELSKQIVDID